MGRYIFVFALLIATLLLDAGACKLKPYVKNYKCTVREPLKKWREKNEKPKRKTIKAF